VSIAKLLLAVVGFAVVIVLITVPTVIFLKEDAQVERRSFTLQDAFNSSMKPKSYNMRWISDHEYLHLSDGSVFLHDLHKNQTSEFLNEDTFVRAYDYKLSADRKYAAFLSDYVKLWRHSFTATYSLYDIGLKGDTSALMFDTDVQQNVKLAYVWRNNVYVKNGPTSPSVQVTFNGRDNQILNGHPDWVYEEEMFSSNQGLWWSPGGRFVAYAEFNDTDVHNIEYSWYGDDQYPSTISIPYPKPGTPNPIVKLFVVDSDNTTHVDEVVVPAIFGSVDHYLASVTWATDNRLAVQWLKRLQNHLVLQIYNFTDSGWVTAEHQEVKSSSGWIGRFSPSEPVFTSDANSYYLLMSDTNQYKHIHHGTPKAITSGEWEVINIVKVTADRLGVISETFLNCVRWTGQKITCLTCGLGDNCQYNSAYFSHNASFYRLSCSGQSRSFYIQYYHKRKFMNSLLFLVLVELWYQMLLPAGFDKSKKYPLLIDVYAGPCSQQVDYSYSVGWSTYLASTEKIIVASFDGRGSGYQGDKLMHELYKRLGTYEVEDQIAAAREFIKFGYIDKDRVAIWGWSYGGYVTSMALGTAKGVFKCGMAVAPVSKWTYYDSIYTERYMQQPSENPEFYSTTVTALAKNFHSVKYLLIHGTADDNVHFQQAAEISEALVEEQVDFEAMWYTDKDHGLSGSANHHVYTHMSHFLLRCFE
uniref:Dipeptidyl peptidase 4-like n=1 Tax=Gouania willdenowi TaxID=441366 RepID=A0A8C5I770_GOUWI